MADKKMIKHSGGCHCGRVKFEIVAPAKVKVAQCNCSMCSKSGYLGLTVPSRFFTLFSGADSLTSYQFNTGIARHTFCKYCGIKSFYTPRSHPGAYNVNARCLDEETFECMDIVSFDGQNWEQQYPQGRADKFLNY